MLSFCFTCDHCRDQQYYSRPEQAKGWYFLADGEEAAELILRDIGATRGQSLLCPACRPKGRGEATR
jgi:hypothetical protein